jgi:hypothetical protein
MPRVFKDAGHSIYDFGDEFLVRCPQCARCARVVSAGDQHPFPKRAVCASCGYVKDGEGTHATIGRATDWYFGLALWLEISCLGHSLWAYNAAHLDFLEAYVRADLRPTSADNSLRNKTLASRLPPWIKSGKNREAILRCIAKLRRSLAET